MVADIMAVGSAATAMGLCGGTLLQVINERFEAGLLVERVVYVYPDVPPPEPPAASALLVPGEPTSPSAVVSIADWIKQKGEAIGL